MRKFGLLFSISMLISFSALAADGVVEQINYIDLLKTYGTELLIAVLALVKIIVRITPSLKDDDVFGKLDKFLEIIFPNLQKK